MSIKSSLCLLLIGLATLIMDPGNVCAWYNTKTTLADLYDATEALKAAPIDDDPWAARILPDEHMGEDLVNVFSFVRPVNFLKLISLYTQKPPKCL